MRKRKDVAAYVAQGPRRMQVMETVAKYGTAYTSEIIQETKMYRPHVSRALKELQEVKVVKWKNPEEPRFKQYTLTEGSKKVLQKARELKTNTENKE